MVSNLYVLVYGEEWEDIAYYTDILKAYKKLVLLSISYIERHGEFFPFIHSYYDIDGIYKKERITYSLNINKYKILLKTYRADDIKNNPSLAFDAIDSNG